MAMPKPAPPRRKVVPIAEAKERRRDKAAATARAAALDLLPNDPDVASSFTMLGNLALIAGKLEEAIEPYSRALNLSPDDVDARSGRGRAYQALGEHALALADFDRLVRLAPDDARHHHRKSGHQRRRRKSRNERRNRWRRATHIGGALRLFVSGKPS